MNIINIKVHEACVGHRNYFLSLQDNGALARVLRAGASLILLRATKLAVCHSRNEKLVEQFYEGCLSMTSDTDTDTTLKPYKP